jgi:hypothetical protein
MNDLDQWALYGMFAALLEAEDERFAVALMITEADGEGVFEEFDSGMQDMYNWLCAQRYARLRAMPRGTFNVVSGNPLTLH